MVIKLSLKSFFKANKLLSVTFLSLMIICFISLLFGINYGYCNSDFYNRYESKQKTYIINQIRPNKEISKSISTFIENNKSNLDYIYIYCNDVYYDANSQINNQINMEIKLFQYIIDELNNGLKAYYGKSFSQEDIENGNKKIILSSQFGKEFIGKEINIFNDVYEVIGIADSNYIPLNSVNITDNEEKVNEIVIGISKIIKDNRKRDEFNNYMKNTFPFGRVITPDEDYKTIIDYLPMLIPTLLVVVICIINLGFLYVFFIKKKKRSLDIYKLCGASKYECIKILIVEFIILVTLSFISSSIIYKIIMIIAFPKVTLSEMINVGLCVYDTLSIFRMIVIYLMVLFITTLLFLPQIVKSINNEAMVEE